MIHVIYFNQWFSSMTEVMRDMKEKHRNSIRIHPVCVLSDKRNIYIVDVERLL